MNGFYLVRHLKGIAGYFLDVVAAAALIDKNPRGLVKFGVLHRVKKISGARCLVETGTFEGVTTHRASFVFDRVVSIELDEALSKTAAQRLAKRKNVEIVCGDGAKLLASVMQRENLREVLVLLDGHYSGGGTAAGDIFEPVVDELAVLAGFKEKLRAIVIDDFRTFDGSIGFPQKSDVFRAIESWFQPHGFRCSVFFDQIIVWAPLSCRLCRL